MAAKDQKAGLGQVRSGVVNKTVAVCPHTGLPKSEIHGEANLGFETMGFNAYAKTNP